MITDAIITHLTTALDGSYRTVAGALDLDRLAKGRGGAAGRLCRPPGRSIRQQPGRNW